MYLVIFSISTYPIGIIKFCECRTIHRILLPCSTFIFIKLMLLVPRNRSWSLEVFVFLNTLVKDFRHCTQAFFVGCLVSEAQTTHFLLLVPLTDAYRNKHKWTRLSPRQV